MKTILKILMFAALLLALIATASGCGRRQVRYFGYLDCPAAAALKGSINGMGFRATLTTADRVGTASDFTLIYHAPAALEGLTVYYNAATDTYRVALGDLRAEGTSYTALGEIGTLLVCEQAVQTTARTSEGNIRFETEDGATRILSPDGTPLHVSRSRNGRAIEIEVQVWSQQ